MSSLLPALIMTILAFKAGRFDQYVQITAMPRAMLLSSKSALHRLWLPETDITLGVFDSVTEYIPEKKKDH